MQKNEKAVTLLRNKERETKKQLVSTWYRDKAIRETELGVSVILASLNK